MHEPQLQRTRSWAQGLALAGFFGHCFSDPAVLETQITVLRFRLHFYVSNKLNI